MSYTQYITRVLSTHPSVSITPRCSCSRLTPLPYLYICTNCSPANLRCNACTLQAVDTYYCPSCLNSFFSKQAFPNENRCEQCLECPTCFHTLSTISRPTSTSSSTLEYIYMCESCQWNSSTCNPPLVASDPSSLLSSLRSRDTTSLPKSQLTSLIDTYQPRKHTDIIPIPLHISHDEGDVLTYVKQREEMEQKIKQQHYLLLDKDTVSQHNNTIIHQHEVDMKYVTMKDGYDIMNMTQKMAQIGIQGNWMSDAIPRRKNLLIKTTHRCKKCNSYVVKPGAGASNLSFEILHAAIASLPKITIAEYGTLQHGQTTRLILYFKNPLVTLVNLSINEKVEDEEDENEEESKKQPQVESYVRVDMNEIKTYMAAYDEIPEDNAIWAENKKDDKDDPNVIASRHLSKVGVYVNVTPLTSDRDITFSLLVTLEPESEPVAGFDRMEYEIVINLGKCAS